MFLFFGCKPNISREGEFVAKSAQMENKTYRYIVYIPPEWNASEKLPVLLFLHGAGERGNDGSQIEVGVGPAIKNHPDWFKRLIVVFPQAPAGSRWIGWPEKAAMAALDRTILELNADKARVYLSGISMGGYGTWHLAAQYPQKFSALVPVCGGIMAPSNVRAVRQLPLTTGKQDPYKLAAARMPKIRIWIFHGSDDAVIPVSESRQMYRELKRIGADVRYTEYPGVDHNSWDQAYSDRKLWEWMLQ